ncbi:MAG: hypothetical protein U9Q98_05310 [Bacteroidota bacterium]|nr:hypothetical protein [Bacteroidota bacterium]
MNNLKRITAYLLVFITVVMTILAILGIWDVINMEDILKRSLTSLFVIFVSSVVVLFIFSVLIKDDKYTKSRIHQNQGSQAEDTDK